MTSRFAGGTPWFMAWAAFLPLVLIRAENLAESDTFWAIRTGILIIDSARIPAYDTFSWTVAGQPWTLNSWGFNTILAAAYLAMGLAGSAIVASMFIAAIGALILFQARKWGANPVVSGFVLVIGGALTTTWITARPQIVDYAAMLVMLILLDRLRTSDRPWWSIVGLGVLTVLWANLHAAALLGALTCAAATVGVLLRDRRTLQAVRFAAATVIVGICCLVTPYGTGIIAQTLQVKNQSSNIREWQPFDAGDPLQLLVLAIGLIGVMAAFRRRDLLTLSVLAIILLASLAAYRILPILLILSLPVIASAAPKKLLCYFESRRKMLSQGAAAAIAIASVISIVNIGNLGRPDPSHFPQQALAHIPPNCNTYNDYQLGGLVILQRPDVKVSIDSRNDLYGAERVDKSLSTVAGNGDVEGELRGAGCALVPPGSGLADALRASPYWTETFSEPAAAVFVRTHE
ncbi:hypothetical protein AB0280_08840 [Pseudarthrobacter sp902506025]|uniref:hypothetical protein n=1 Tax=Pseudarthrobacter sp. 902506025 TaxID=3155291 RepID=UPI00344FDDC1